MKPWTFIFWILYRAYRFVSWLRYHTTKRLTAAGWIALVAFGAVIMTGIDTDNTVAYQALAPLFFLLLIGPLLTPFFRARFSATRRLPRFGTVGRPIHYTVSVKNLSKRPQSGLTLLENLADPRPSFEEWLQMQLADERRVQSFRFSQGRRSNPFRPATVKEAAVPPMRAGEAVDVRVELTPLHRGLLHFGGILVARADPIGFFRAFSRASCRQTMLILPRRYALPPLALPGTMKYQEGGVALAANIGRSDEFVSLRDYRRGDPLRHIHWRSWAKVGRPIVREFEDEFFVRHALILDTFTNDPYNDAFEEAVSVAASFAHTIPSQESLLDLLFVGQQAYCFTAGRGLAHADQMLEVLASVRASTDKSFSALEHMVLNHAALVSGCICIFLAWDEPRRDLVRKLRVLGVPVLVLVIVERRSKEPLDPGPLSNDPAQFHVLQVGFIEEALSKLAV